MFVRSLLGIIQLLMSPNTAQRIFIFFVIVAIPISLWPFWDLATLYTAVKNMESPIDFDMGIFYLWLISVFFTLYFIQKKGLEKGKEFSSKLASLFLVIHFLTILLLAYALPIAIKHWLIENNYQYCSTQEYTGISRSELGHYTKGRCN